MKLALIGDDGTVVDTTEEFTREEWIALSITGKGACADELNARAS